MRRSLNRERRSENTWVSDVPIETEEEEVDEELHSGKDVVLTGAGNL